MAKKIDLDGLEFFKSKENAMVADEYSSSKTYALGDYAYHAGTLYKCTTAITTAEAWTVGHWTAAKLADDLASQSEQIDAFNILCNPDLKTATSNHTCSISSQQSIIREMDTLSFKRLGSTTSYKFVCLYGMADGSIPYASSTATATNNIEKFLRVSGAAPVNLPVKTENANTRMYLDVYCTNHTSPEENQIQIYFATYDSTNDVYYYSGAYAVTDQNKTSSFKTLDLFGICPMIKVLGNMFIVARVRAGATMDMKLRLYYQSEFSPLTMGNLENPNAASKSYAVNDFLVLGRFLYRVKQPIQTGDAITAGTNVEQTSICDQLSALLNATIEENAPWED